ncbi:MAG: acyltransferase, partial [Elusimicrobiota bacterium]|nr:acyltransferase [Elusimicrobiota bacterium]
MLKNSTRIDYLDGLRGWAALVVCMGHTLSVFYMNDFASIIINGYFKLLVDGGMAVKIFFVLSGFVLSMSFIKNPEIKKLAALLIKRIPRLSIPIFAMALIVHFLMNSGLMFNSIVGHWNGHYKFDSTIFKVFESSFLLSFFGYATPEFVKGPMYSGTLWTMPYEMVGSIFVAIALLLASFINKNKRIISIIIVFVGLIFLSYQKALFAGTVTCFLFGILLAYYLVNMPKTPPPILLRYKILLAIIILLLYYSNSNYNFVDIKRN